VAALILTAVTALVAAFGGAWYGARLQRANNADALALELQIDAAAKFLGAVGEAVIGYSQSNKPEAETLSPAERTEPSWIALIGLSVRASAVAIVGPDALAEIAKQIQGQAMVADYFNIVGGTEGAAAQKEIGRLAEEFENEARRLLRPTSGQKGGRRWIPWRRVKPPEDGDDSGESSALQTAV
jgi:hypothetical protein